MLQRYKKDTRGTRTCLFLGRVMLFIKEVSHNKAFDGNSVEVYISTFYEKQGCFNATVQTESTVFTDPILAWEDYRMEC